MTSQSVLTPETPSRDECTMALLAHLLQVFTGFIGPLIIFLVKQDSRFVKFHSLQALIWQLSYMVAIFATMIVFFASVFASVFKGVPPGQGQPPPELFVFFPLIWVLIMGGWVLNIVLGILYGIKASHGEWAGYPLIGKWLRTKYMPNPSAAPAL
jgi:uncharacterized protein